MESANQAIPSSEEMKQRGNRVEFIVLALCAVGLVMVYSASAPFQDQKHLLSADGGWRLLLSQTKKLALALVAYLIGRRLDIEMLRRHSGKFFLVSIALLALVLPFGITLNKSTRWLQLGPITFQPVEFVKLTLVLFLAASLAKLGDRIRELKELLWLVGISILPVLALLYLQPDFGSSVFLLGTVLVLVIISGARRTHYIGGSLAGFAVLYTSALLFFPHVVSRFAKHVDLKPGDQVYQALLALGTGGFTGYEGGLGAGVSKLGYVPMIQSDFIFAAIGEETGFIGSSLVLVLFAAFVWAGARVVMGQADRFRFLLASGIVIEAAVQALINLVVVTKIGPTKGIALPFISSGGSALLFSMLGIGILVGMTRQPASVKSTAPRARSRGRGDSDELSVQSAALASSSSAQ